MDDLEDSSDCHNHPEHQSLDQCSVQEPFSLADRFPDLQRSRPLLY